MIRRQYYGWFDRMRNEWRLSLLPPDAPVRPSKAFLSKGEVAAFIQRKRCTVLWYPPLTRDQQQGLTAEAL